MRALRLRKTARDEIEDAFEWYRRQSATAAVFKIYERTISVVGVIHGHRHPRAWLRHEP